MIYELTNYLINALFKIHENNTKVYNSNTYSEQILLELITFLEEKDFPSNSFDIQCPVSKHFASYAKNMTPDLTIINPDTMQPLAFFKTYDSVESFEKDNLFDEAYHFNKHSNTLLIYPYYVVIKAANHLQFYNLRSILSYSQGKKLDTKLATSEPIKYSVLANNNDFRNTRSKIINRNKLQGFGKIAFSFIVPLAIIALLILDGLCVYPLTELRLVAFGLIILSIFIPYITQISIKDFSVTFKDKKNKDK